MAETTVVQPFLKWAGGKRQLLPEIRKYIPKHFTHYYEPFIGAGAVLFDLKPHNATINDVNAELINVYNVIRTDVDNLVRDLQKHQNNPEYFYEIRALDRTEAYHHLSPLQRASRLIYLNKTCYNGLFRVNSKGQFNVPFGKYKNPSIVNEDVLRVVSDYLNNNHVTILNEDFEEAVQNAGEGDLVYFDPPYDPVSETSSFTSYSNEVFTRDDQTRLRDLYLELHKRGCYVLLSNSDTPFINEIYQELHTSNPEICIKKVQASRAINSQGAKRGKINEVLVVNFGEGEE
ncbi:DNA adenine methylase [Aneurinibacillus migulanus]|uniref:DNA adenine methylase n=1 Tax=Aneurinibacillus migulanus TaxID=47500 RepID=UPI00209EC21B|nr:DNA adenine methylase [Aneurinibacillus migulanus]MCP1357222.1 DNA adenine methylase [Aneurinibacillus migulanus]